MRRTSVSIGLWLLKTVVAWASGKVATNYLSVTPTSDGSLTATVKCLQAFGEQIIITIRSRSNTSATASCTVDYYKRVEVYDEFCYCGWRVDNQNVSWDINFGETNYFEYKPYSELPNKGNVDPTTNYYAYNDGWIAVSPRGGVGTIECAEDDVTESTMVTFSQNLKNCILATGIFTEAAFDWTFNGSWDFDPKANGHYLTVSFDDFLLESWFGDYDADVKSKFATACRANPDDYDFKIVYTVDTPYEHLEYVAKVKYDVSTF